MYLLFREKALALASEIQQLVDHRGVTITRALLFKNHNTYLSVILPVTVTEDELSKMLGRYVSFHDNAIFVGQKIKRFSN